jgi:hypothetical protein
MAKPIQHIAKDPNIYVRSVEEKRPLVQPTFEEYIKVFELKVIKARQAMKDTWK